ncbi:NAD-dependent epimerase/dehydratase family protein [Shewanella algae]|nr:NAD-dependent epimerase/dehydratase family protein [Shewanella algae]
MNRILITGANGFVGKEMLKSLTSRCSVRAQVRTKNKGHAGLCDYVELDVNGSTDWRECLQGVTTVIHLAAVAHNNLSSAEYMNEVNVMGTMNLAQQATELGVKRFVYISSIGVNGASTHESAFSQRSIVNPHSTYALSKYEAEVGLNRVSQATGIELVIVRPTLVYGTNAPGNFGLLTKLVNKLPFLPFGLTNNKRDFISVQNLADLLITCAKHPSAAGHTFLASDGETVSIKDFTNAIAKGLNKKLIQLPVPVGLMRFAARFVGKSAMAEQLLGNLQVDSSNAKEVLGWTPPYTMEQAMASLSESKK